MCRGRGTGGSPAKQKQNVKLARAKTSTFAEFSARFFAEVQEKDHKDCSAQRRYLTKDILPFIGDKIISEVQVDNIRSIIWRKKDHGFDAAAGQIRSLLKRIIDAIHRLLACRSAQLVSDGTGCISH